jgi:uncharacterized protein (TIGR02001 family)
MHACSFCTTAGPGVCAVLFDQPADMMHLRNGRRSRLTSIHGEDFMRGLKAIAAVLLMSAAGVAHAQFSATVTAVSDYDFRGISLSGTDPALQGSIDWAHDSGFYAGAWGSCCLDFGEGTEAEYEVDLYAGFTGGSEDGFGWDAGIVYYFYRPEDDPSLDYPEIYFGGSYGFFDAKVWYTNDYNALDIDAYYLEGNVTFDVGANFSILAHVGYNWGDYWKDFFGDEPIDYSVGVGYTLGHFSLELKYVDMESDVEITDDPFNNEGRVIFSASTTFPWSSE